MGNDESIRGTWPENCLQRAFVDGASWWQFHTRGTMYASEREQAEAEAVKRFGPVAPEQSDDEVIRGLRYIADSPAQEFGGFHPNAVLAAKNALALIEQLRAPQGTPPTPDYKALCELAARVLLQHMNDEDYELSLAGLYARLTEHVVAEAFPDKCPTPEAKLIGHTIYNQKSQTAKFVRTGHSSAATQKEK